MNCLVFNIYGGGHDQDLRSILVVHACSGNRSVVACQGATSRVIAPEPPRRAVVNHIHHKGCSS